LASTKDIPVSNINHPFSIGISEVALMGRSKMDLGLVQRVRDVIWEYTRRQARDHFGYSELVCKMEYVVIDEHVVAEEGVL
jgi:hypothetical protein